MNLEEIGVISLKKATNLTALFSSSSRTVSYPRDLIVTIQTNTPNVEPTSQVKFSLLVTQTIDDTRVVATFDNKKSLYSNTSFQYVKQS